MRQHLVLRAVISAVFLILIAVHIGRPEVKIDLITVVLLVICAIPWLQPLIKTIELPGGVKVELQELREKVAEARGAAESATQQATLAVSASYAPATTSHEPVVSKPAEPKEIQALADEYDQIRKTQRSGDARTAAMTNVVRRMIDLANRTESFDIAAALRDGSRGMRLFAYMYLYARPNAQLLLPLVESVTIKEDKPFGQYWGLQAIGRVMSTAERISPEVRSKLRTFGAKIQPGTDRDYELKKLLRQLQ